MSEVSNDSDVIIGDKEFLCSSTIQIDIYCHKKQEVREMGMKVSEIMIAAGFRRSFSKDIFEEGIPRKTLQFSAKIEENSGRIYAGVN